MNDAFAAFLTRYQRDELPAIERLANSAGVQLLERVANKLRYGAMSKLFVFPDTEAGIAAQLPFVKFVQELYAAIGCVRAGSMVGAYHHLRAVIELRAIVHHLFSDPVTTRERAHKLVEWTRGAATYIDYRKHKTERDARPADDLRAQAKFDILTATSAEILAQVDDTKRHHWAHIYGAPTDSAARRLRRLEEGAIVSWHDPSRITKLVEQLPDAVLTAPWYDLACNATHFSPVGEGLNGTQDGVRMLGWDPRSGRAAVQIAIQYAQMFCRQMDAQCGATLEGLLADEWKLFETERNASLAASGWVRPSSEPQ